MPVPVPYANLTNTHTHLLKFFRFAQAKFCQLRGSSQRFGNKLGTKSAMERQGLGIREFVRARRATAYEILFLTHNPEVAIGDGRQAARISKRLTKPFSIRNT